MKIQTFFEKAGKGACLALCYIRASLGEKATPNVMFDVLWKASEKGILVAEDDFFVKDAVALGQLASGKKFSVTKQKISSIEELEGKLAAVNFQNGKFNHWVLVENGQIVFDSLEDSQCVKYGKPVDARVIG